MKCLSKLLTTCPTNMSATRRPDEDFAAFKVRQKAEAKKAKLSPYMCRDLADSYKQLPTGQLISEEGITRGRARAMKYKAASAVAKKGKK